ncbi:ABC transporter permease [Castellaniella sp. GW247-6E4]|uniref:ABC transporter permease n=1 Tax=Castellaniella sp. GW247-6E4 TaxID=3140380 RepID=UPI003315A40B
MSTLSNFKRNILPGIVFGVFILAVWYFISYVMLEPSKRFLLVPPHDVWTAGFADPEVLIVLLQSLWSSTRVAVIGLLISTAIGFSIAIAMSQTPLIERALFPYMVALQAIPILALVPLISFWAGFGQTSRIIVCVLISLFPIIVNTLFGLQSAKAGAHDLFTLHNANRWVRLRKLMFPAALPAIFAGLRISAGLSVVGAIVGDFFFARGEVGIGQMIRQYSSELAGAELFAAIILSSALGVSVFLVFGWMSKLFVGKWADTQ